MASYAARLSAKHPLEHAFAGSQASALARKNKVVNADHIGAIDKKALVGMTLVVGAGDPNPERDFACPDRTCEMSRVPGNEPMAESIFQTACS